MSVTIKRPFNNSHPDPFEILLDVDDSPTVVLHPHDRPASDRILIAVLEDLDRVEIRH